MSKLFYSKLALNNLKNNKKTYIPYILTCIGTVLMFYCICAMATHDTALQSVGLSSMLGIGTIVTAIFIVIFLLYTNSFLIKRRKKEFGLFNILGMEKRHIGKIMCWETLYIAIISLVTGIGLGLVFSKLMTLILYKIIGSDLHYEFYFNGKAIVITIALFAVIFLITLVKNLLSVHMSKPVELLKGGNVGEKEPKTKWILTLIGVLTLGAGYYFAITITNPLSAFGMFFIAVILVMIGTYSLFTAGSIAVLKTLRKNKSYFYKTNHFTSVSGMIYRMKQNAAGLASICILSTAVLVMVSTTVSLFAGEDDVIKRMYPNDMNVTVRYRPEKGNHKDEINDILSKVSKRQGRKLTDVIEKNDMHFSATQQGDMFVITDPNFSMNNQAELDILTLDTYNRLAGTNETLSDGEVLLNTEGQKIGDTFSIDDKNFTVKKRLDSMPFKGELNAWMTNVHCIVVKDDDAFKELYDMQLTAYKSNASTYNYSVYFNTDGNKDEKIAFYNEVDKDIKDNVDVDRRIDCREVGKKDFDEMYGSLFFLGIFIGFLFTMATVLIIYYKQVVEGYDDKERFSIMQNVGMSKEEVKKTINSQVLTVFFIPLIAAFVHLAFAFPMLTRLLNVLNLKNVGLFGLCAVTSAVVFALIYVIVYLLTAKVYYKIVYDKR